MSGHVTYKPLEKTYPAKLADRFFSVRDETERRAAPLTDEDQILQSMPDASPTKWHRAHTTWFFEEFVLATCQPEYVRIDPTFSFLFNSYYVNAGPRFERPKRGLISRPSVKDVSAYRRSVDCAMDRMLINSVDETTAWLVEVGLHHEQQHQELIFTDILHAFAQNPLRPAYDRNWSPPQAARDDPDWVTFSQTITTVGHQGSGYSYDNEGPPHRCLLQTFRLRRTLVTNAEWIAFIENGGYATQTLWLNDGWIAAQNGGWTAPGYWECIDGAWYQLTLGGLRPIDPDAPVCHISYYEADAFARWANKHLPTEFEWEFAAQSGRIADAFGIVWQWTRSAYAPYPGYQAAQSALGEYNGKFMINQMVLRGSSFATPEGHSRPTYRNFFYPASRWQFTGLRLADYEC